MAGLGGSGERSVPIGDSCRIGISASMPQRGAKRSAGSFCGQDGEDSTMEEDDNYIPALPQPGKPFGINRLLRIKSRSSGYNSSVVFNQKVESNHG